MRSHSYNTSVDDTAGHVHASPTASMLTIASRNCSPVDTDRVRVIMRNRMMRAESQSSFASNVSTRPGSGASFGAGNVAVTPLHGQNTEFTLPGTTLSEIALQISITASPVDSPPSTMGGVNQPGGRRPSVSHRQSIISVRTTRQQQGVTNAADPAAAEMSFVTFTQQRARSLPANRRCQYLGQIVWQVVLV